MEWLRKIFPRIDQYPLSYRMLGYVLLCSSTFTLSSTATQLYIEYRRDVSNLYDSIEFIEKSYLAPISEPSKTDELDRVVMSINALQDRLSEDIARRKRQEEALRHAEEKYRTAADFTCDWKYCANVDNSLNYVSPSCERISDCTIRDFIDNPSLFKVIIVPEDRDVWDRHYHDARRELKPCEIQIRIQRRDGQICWIEHSCQPVI